MTAFPESPVQGDVANNSLPSGWQWTRLLDVTRHHSGNSKLIKGKLHGAPGDDLFPAFSASGQDVWREGYESEGDAIIVSAVGARCGKAFLASGKWSAIANTHVVWPEASKIERKFLWYRINDERFWIRSGTAQPFVVVRKTFERPFALPPLDEQHRIVAEIEKQLTRLDAGTASLNQVQLALRAYRDSVSEAACMGRLVPTEAELARAGNRKYESGNQLLQRTIRDSPSIRSDSAGADSHALPELSGLRDLPEGWTRATLKQLCPLFIDSAHRTPVYSTEGFPALGPRDMVGGRLKLANARRIDQSEFAIQTRRHIPQPGDIVYSRELSYGWGAVVPSGEQFCMSQGMCLFRPSDAVDLRYFVQVLNGPMVRRQAAAAATGSAHPHINLGAIKNYIFPLPPAAEQERIAEEVEKRLSIVDDVDLTLATAIERASRLRQSILSWAFSGRLLLEGRSRDAETSVIPPDLLEKTTIEPREVETPIMIRYRRSKTRKRLVESLSLHPNPIPPEQLFAESGFEEEFVEEFFEELREEILANRIRDIRDSNGAVTLTLGSAGFVE